MKAKRFFATVLCTVLVMGILPIQSHAYFLDSIMSIRNSFDTFVDSLIEGIDWAGSDGILSTTNNDHLVMAARQARGRIGVSEIAGKFNGAGPDDIRAEGKLWGQYVFTFTEGANSNSDSNQFDGPSTHQNGQMNYAELLAAAQRLLDELEDNDVGYYTALSDTDKAELWPVRMKAALFVAYGYAAAEGMEGDILNALNVSCKGVQEQVSCGPLLTWFDSGAHYRYSGVYYVTIISQELAEFVAVLGNEMGPFVAKESRAFSSHIAEVKAVSALHDGLEFFDDPALWNVWNKQSWSTKSNDLGYGKVSLQDIYEFLLSAGAFSILDRYSVDENAPFAYFFDSNLLSSDIVTGIVESAKFIPMHTNVYDPYTWTGEVDNEWLLNYYAKFGYMRKVLYIDTNADAASNFVNTGGKGQLEVATLDDLLQPKDIVLYIDDNLYNVDDIGEMVDKSWDRLGQEKTSSSLGLIDSFVKAFTSLWNVSMEELAKSAERTQYTTRVKENLSKKWDNFFLPLVSTEDEVDTDTGEVVASGIDGIDKYLYPDDIYDVESNGLRADYEQVAYTPMFGFAVLSGVYRDWGVKTNINSVSSSNMPVFISSETAPYISSDYTSCLFNYALLQNISAVMPVDYATSLDMTSPLYLDVFGNILTESGYVVVPAAANATLWKNETYEPYNAAFMYCYGKGEYLEHFDTATASSINSMLEKWMEPVDGKWVMRSVQTVGGDVDLAHLSIADKDSIQSLADTFAYNLSVLTPYDIKFWQFLITEVLRGAPIENIDKQFEGIQTNVTYTRQGLIVADKLEALVDAIAPAGQNASLAIPNPAYIDGLEVIIFFIYKLLILGVLVVWMINIYLDATAGQIGLRTAGKCIGVVVLVIAMIIGVPKIFEITYYESNKLLLSEETELLMMLNLEKEANGEEIGVSKVRVPETNTKLYLRLAEVEMPWWDLLSSITVSSGYNSLDEMYQQYEGQHPLAYTDQATTMNGQIYIDVDTLFDSAKVTFSPITQYIYVTGAADTPASYYTPYYYFLTTITSEISAWSKGNSTIAYTTRTQRGGELKTLGYCKGFFENEEFIQDGMDFFNLYALYNVPAPRTYNYLENPNSNETSMEKYDLLRDSQWCNMSISTKGIQDRIVKLNEYAQEWIANNRGMIGRVSDETFLKCFALSCAMEHNRLFNTQRADYLEIQQLSNEDLLRLSITSHDEVINNSSMSYARFVYTTGGTIACYVAAVLELVNLISSWVKPAVTLLVFLIACISIFVLKLILRRGNNSIFGYITTIVLMCSVNVVGALFTKLSMYIPSLGFTPTICMLIQILVQIAYIFLQLKIVVIALKDWRNVGFQEHESAYNRINPFTRGQHLSRDVATPHASTGHEYLDRLMKRNMPRRMIA